MDVGHFVRTGTIKQGKILSLTMRDVACVIKGKSREGKGIWKSISTGKDWREFYHSLSQYIIENAGQGMPCSSYYRTLCDFRRKTFGVGCHGQGLLFSSQLWTFVEEMTGNADGIQRPANVKKQGRDPPKERIIQQKGRSRTTNRACKEVWIRKKQNEIGRGHAGIGIPICHGIQSPPINEKIAGCSQLAKA